MGAAWTLSLCWTLMARGPRHLRTAPSPASLPGGVELSSPRLPEALNSSSSLRVRETILAMRISSRAAGAGLGRRCTALVLKATAQILATRRGHMMSLLPTLSNLLHVNQPGCDLLKRQIQGH